MTTSDASPRPAAASGFAEDASVRGVGLAFAYPDGDTLFSGISITAGRGDVIAVTGASGSGKSTLLYCIAGVLVASGDLTIMGEKMPGGAPGRADLRRRQIGFVFQRGELLPELSVLENVALPLRLTGHGRKQSLGQAQSALDQLEIGDCANRPTAQISGGQAQRASVARALICQPPVVLADEPTASLDGTSRDIVIGTLRSYAAAGRAVITATHDPVLIGIATDRLQLGGSHHRDNHIA